MKGMLVCGYEYGKINISRAWVWTGLSSYSSSVSLQNSWGFAALLGLNLNGK